MNKHLSFILSILVLSVSLTGCCCCSSDPDSAGSIEFESQLLCRQAIRSNLKSPGSADFADSYTGLTLDQKSTKRYTVMGSVDAENSFGAKVTQNYLCIINYDVETQNYRIYNLKMY